MVPGWPGNKTGGEVVEHMIQHAAMSDGGVSYELGYDWGQLLQKFMIGAVSYNQIVDNYLDEKMTAGDKPNNKPYSEGAAYTGKEHSWDEGFGYFGAPAHALELAAADAYNISKKTALAAGALSRASFGSSPSPSRSLSRSRSIAAVFCWDARCRPSIS